MVTLAGDGWNTEVSDRLRCLNVSEMVYLEHSKTEDYELIIHDGFPADSVPIALSMRDNFDLFVSGINPGANLGYHRMLTSGTIGAALEAALQGYPALAVSQDVESKYWFTQNGVESGLDLICSHTLRIIECIFAEGFPEGIDVLNLNFPKRVVNSCIEVGQSWTLHR